MSWRKFSSAVLLALSLCMASVAQSSYFPAQALGGDDSLEKYNVEWYSKFLKAMQEPSLWETSKNSKAQSYRFLWLRSFHHPVSIRLEIKSDGTSLLTTKISSGHGGYEPGLLTTNRTQKLGRDQTSWVLDRIEEVKFWNLPTNPPPNPDVVGLDGARWIFEGVKDGTYHVVDRWSPDKGEIHTLGIMMLIDVAKLKLLYQEVY